MGKADEYARADPAGATAEFCPTAWPAPGLTGSRGSPGEQEPIDIYSVTRRTWSLVGWPGLPAGLDDELHPG